jgi:hypothetical protein
LGSPNAVLFGPANIVLKGDGEFELFGLEERPKLDFSKVTVEGIKGFLFP